MRLLSTFATLAIGAASASHSAMHRRLAEARANGLPEAKVNGSYIPATSPRDNIFSEISKDESKAVHKFLKSQANVTLPGDMLFNEYDSLWLLAPNKTEATSYLDDNGPKPPRFARAMGRTECYSREYMVGPLPVDDSTKATPLDYPNNGNGTVDNGWCNGNGTASASARTRQGRRQRAEDREANNNNRRFAPHNPYEEKQTWNKRELPHDDKAPPVTILPDGARHEFDPKQNYVSWMDFTFFVSTGPGGISIHDVRFRGERVVYELAMQEALAHYAGPDQAQTEASFLDVTIGFTEFNLIPGYDCPAYATYTNAFCLFEFPKDYPMSRHSDWEYYHATKNIAFLLRSISTVGNYDYQTTYEFYYDGSIQVLVRASGYIQASDYVDNADAWDYGFHIRKDLSGSMHDHVLNFKADLDIKGTKNSLFKTEFVPHSQVYDWSNGKVVNTMKVDRSFITNEDQGKINWAPNSAASYAVVNTDKKNEFGEAPGFRIYPSTGSTIHLTVENSTKFPNAINWATHPLYALQRKDTEITSAHPDETSLIDFNNFFNGESLDQEDIVLYFNLGMHHMPDTYDLPVTVFQGSQSGITLRPQNYLRSENSPSTRQQIDVTGEEGNVKVKTYGAKSLSGSYDLAEAEPSRYPSPDSFHEEL